MNLCQHCDQPIESHDVQKCGRRIAEAVEEHRRSLVQRADDLRRSAVEMQSESEQLARLKWEATHANT